MPSFAPSTAARNQPMRPVRCCSFLPVDNLGASSTVAWPTVQRFYSSYCVNPCGEGQIETIPSREKRSGEKNQTLHYLESMRTRGIAGAGIIFTSSCSPTCLPPLEHSISAYSPSPSGPR